MKVNIEEKVKLVSVGFSFTFAVTECNKIYAWQQGFITNEERPNDVEMIE